MIFKKKERLEPLRVSDVVVQIISQDKTKDRTVELKNYLYKVNRKMSFELEDEQPISLPPFCVKEMAQQELLLLHLQHNHQKIDSIRTFEGLLQHVQGRLYTHINNSASDFTRNQQYLNQLAEQLQKTYHYLSTHRHCLSRLSFQVNQKCVSLIKKHRRAVNMRKAVEVMELWKQNHISAILFARVDQVLKGNDLRQVFSQFNKSITFMKNSNGHLASFGSSIEMVEKRRDRIVDGILANMVGAIINYQSESQYQIQFEQYQIAFETFFTTLSADKHLLSEGELAKTIETDLSTVFNKIISKRSVNCNLETLNEDQYVDALQQLMEEYIAYFENWHKATSFHVGASTSYGEVFIKLRNLVLQKAARKVGQVVKFSHKFSQLRLEAQLSICQTIAEFIECGEEWMGCMGACSSLLPQILTSKLKAELISLSKTINGEIKQLLLKQINMFSGELDQEDKKHYKQTQIIRLRLGVQTEIQDLFQGFQQGGLHLAKVESFLGGGLTNCHNKSNKDGIDESKEWSQEEMQDENEDQKSTNQQIKKIKILVISTIRTQQTELGLYLLKSISQFYLRSLLLPSEPHFIQIFENIEFLIIILHKISASEAYLNEIQKSIYDEASKEEYVDGIKLAIGRGAIEEVTLQRIDSLRRKCLYWGKYAHFYQFLWGVGQKFEGFSLTLDFNLNIMYQAFQKMQKSTHSPQVLCEVLIKMSRDLLSSCSFLEKVLSKSKRQSNLGQLRQIQKVVQTWSELYIGCYYYHLKQKIVNCLSPIFQNLKWEIKKIQSDKLTPFKEYKLKFIQLYLTNRLNIHEQPTSMRQIMRARLVCFLNEVFLELYGPIDKINENGRQIVKGDHLEICKGMELEKQLGGRMGNQLYFEQYLQSSFLRNQKALLDIIEKLGVQISPFYWKSNLLWMYSDMSSKEKKQFLLRLANVYMIKLISYP